MGSRSDAVHIGRVSIRRRGWWARCPPALAASASETEAMIAGHFGLAAGVKSRERTVPLWALMLATVWLDVFFVPLFILKIETVVPAQGVHQAYGGAFIYAAY